jgi:hypothetical protein
MSSLSTTGSWAAGLAVAALSAIFLPPPCAGHTKERPLREIVLVRGTSIAADAECAQGLVTLQVMNRTVRLCEGVVRRIAVAAPDIADGASLPASFDLQGERERLAIVTGAPPGTRITVLGEWRPGRKDLFLIEIDACPCANDAPEGVLEKE